LHRPRVGVDAGEVDEPAVMLGRLVVPQPIERIEVFVGEWAAVAR
jgi:hypothetical protein